MILAPAFKPGLFVCGILRRGATPETIPIRTTDHLKRHCRDALFGGSQTQR
jgi:hypothetical protein